MVEVEIEEEYETKTVEISPRVVVPPRVDARRVDATRRNNENRVEEVKTHSRADANIVIQYISSEYSTSINKDVNIVILIALGDIDMIIMKIQECIKKGICCIVVAKDNFPFWKDYRVDGVYVLIENYVVLGGYVFIGTHGMCEHIAKWKDYHRVIITTGNILLNIPDDTWINNYTKPCVIKL